MSNKKEYRVVYRISGHLVPDENFDDEKYQQLKDDDDIEALEEMLDEIYTEADCGAAYDIDGEPDTEEKTFNVVGYFDSFVNAEDDTDAVELSNEELDSADFGDIQDVECTLLHVWEE